MKNGIYVLTVLLAASILIIAGCKTDTGTGAVNSGSGTGQTADIDISSVKNAPDTSAADTLNKELTSDIDSVEVTIDESTFG